jgi:hypothetical protein
MWQLVQLDFATGQTFPWTWPEVLAARSGAWQARHLESYAEGKAWLGCRQVQLVVDDRIGGVTAEAHHGFIVADRAANRLLEILWLPLIVSRGDGEPVDGGVIAHLAFEKLALPLQHPSLRLRTEGGRVLGKWLKSTH